ncbi:AAA family ATPase [Nocardia yamanashiensis]|uniref:BTAD domain-containing putative transcriptional regulator n=1 Tax=Nocardia yamanashiensis TaxID=209247 RepID=UPI001E614D2A|nr:BTAD domain-containing putative transcriptional regulator [Nocardia yamanashiensis]UGT44672.1 AAA family ATPase [Nocardia yamanashiensis]
MSLRIGVLGPLWAATDHGPIALKGPRHHAVLARLLIAHGGVVPVARLIDDLWDDPPRNPVGTLHTFIADLRRALEPDRPPRSPARVLVTAAPGYALRLQPGQLDADRFEELVRAARSRLGERDAGAPGTLPAGSGAIEIGTAASGIEPALADLDAALALWHGPAYAEFADEPWVQAEITRLDELHSAAIELRARALLTADRPAEAAAALETHLRDHPLRENPWHTYALALYRTGRQADALAALRTVREHLRDELGIDPGPALRDLETAVLAHAPSLLAERTSPGSLSPGSASSTSARPPIEQRDPVRGEPGLDPGSDPSVRAVAGPARPPDDSRGSSGGELGLDPDSDPRDPAAAGPARSSRAGGASTWSGRPGLRSGGPSRSPIAGKLVSAAGESAAEELSPAARNAESDSPSEVADRVADIAAPPEARHGAGFVGRAGELERLRRVAAECAERAMVGTALVSGVEGAGKTAVAEVLAAELAGRGWVVAWGGSPEDGGAPPNWPWRRMVAGLAAAGRGVPEAVADGDAEDAAVARFLAQRAAIEYLRGAAAEGPLLLVFDDIHWAGAETLELLTALATAGEAGPVLLLAAYRMTDMRPELTAALARIARVNPVRVQLGGLAEPDIAELVRGIAGDGAGSRVVRQIRQRSAGNPFYASELARLLRDEGESALAEIPAGVRDVVRHRLTRLAERERTVLRQAAVTGLEIDPDLLVALAGELEPVLDALDAATRAGFLDESGPTGTAFTHALVREVVYHDIPAARRAAWHATIGDLLENSGHAEPATLAHHFGRAATRATAPRAAAYARLAALDAEREFAPHESARFWAATLTAYDRLLPASAADPHPTPGRPGLAAGPPMGPDQPATAVPAHRAQEAPAARAHSATHAHHASEASATKGNSAVDAGRSSEASAAKGCSDAHAHRSSEEAVAEEYSAAHAHDTSEAAAVKGRSPAPSERTAIERLEAVIGLMRALAVIGRLPEARAHRAESITAAERSGDPHLTARVIAAFDIPTVWTESDDPELAAAIAAAAERTLNALPDTEIELRTRLLATIALELRATDTGRGRSAAAEAESLARASDDPALLAFALNARYIHTCYRPGLARERGEIGAEIIALSQAHQLVTFEVTGHLIAIQSYSATANFEAADRHAIAADALADRYDLPLVAVFTRWYRALRQSFSPNPQDQAHTEAAYRSAAAALPGAMPGLERGLLPLALLCIRLRQGRPLAFDAETDWGPHEPWVRPLLLLEEQREAEASAALRALPEPPPDLLLELRLALIAHAALTLDDSEVIRRTRDRLQSAAGELAGAGTGLVSLGPVADLLARLSE